jgi:hypothetical protein
MRPYFDADYNTCLLLPCLSISTGECECCGERGGTLIALGFGFWTIGLAIDGNHQH